MPTPEDFKMELHRMMNEAIHQGKATADINAGELDRRVGDYPGPSYRMAMCCAVMRGAIAPDAGDVILKESQIGQDESLTIRYVLPRPEQVP